jgi:hypothetical protein
MRRLVVRSELRAMYQQTEEDATTGEAGGVIGRRRRDGACSALETSCQRRGTTGASDVCVLMWTASRQAAQLDRSDGSRGECYGRMPVMAERVTPSG